MFFTHYALNILELPDAENLELIVPVCAIHFGDSGFIDLPVLTWVGHSYGRTQRYGD